MPLGKELIEKVKKGQEDKNLINLLKEITNSIKDKASLEMITSSIKSLEETIKGIDLSDKNSDALVSILTELKLNSNNKDLLVILEGLIKVNKEVITTMSTLKDSDNFQGVVAELAEVKKYLLESKNAQWEFNIERDGAFNISKVKATRIK
jgi:hypothetical protein